jgi:hypothetical protein
MLRLLSYLYSAILWAHAAVGFLSSPNRGMTIHSYLAFPIEDVPGGQRREELPVIEACLASKIDERGYEFHGILWP